MKLIERYVVKTVLAAIALVTCLLTGLDAFILSVNQLDDLGRGQYGLTSAAGVVLLSLPHEVYLFFPVASLLGCLLGLGLLANQHELIVMRAAGMSMAKIARTVCKAAFILIVLVTVLGETVVPKGLAVAHSKKQQAVNTEQVLLGKQDVWLRAENDFILLGRVLPDNQVEHVVQFHFDEHNRLTLTRTLEKAHFSAGVWQASGVKETVLADQTTRVKQHDAFVWDVALNPALWSISRREPDEMDFLTLHHYLHNTAATHQPVGLRYQLAYWQRFVQPFTTVVMMLLAIPFIFGPLRSSTMGAKLLVGVSVGFGFHLLNRFFMPVSQVLHWPPVLAALTPTVLFALLSLYLLRYSKSGSG